MKKAGGAGAQVVGRRRVPHWSPSLAAFLCSLMLSADEAGVLDDVRVSLADAEARPRT
ncbi:MAG: hypothetical protein Q3979_02945 [Actinomycetaceae bacterium]|nr:hypothetical protein [Actinomycetaceae bacterium]